MVFGGALSALVVTLAQPAPALPVTGTNLGLIPGREYFNIASLEPVSQRSRDRPYLGLCASASGLANLVAQFLQPVGAVPFHFVATATSQSFGPYPLPVGLSGEVMCFDFTSSTVQCVSTVHGFTIQ